MGIAPPRTRCAFPHISRAVRSRRTVSIEISNSLATSAATIWTPDASLRSSICWRVSGMLRSNSNPSLTCKKLHNTACCGSQAKLNSWTNVVTQTQSTRDFTRFKAAIFDLDGSLVHSENAWKAAKIIVLAHYGLVLSRPVLDAHVGRGLGDCIETIVSAAE